MRPQLRVWPVLTILVVLGLATLHLDRFVGQFIVERLFTAFHFRQAHGQFGHLR